MSFLGLLCACQAQAGVLSTSEAYVVVSAEDRRVGDVSNLQSDHCMRTCYSIAAVLSPQEKVYENAEEQVKIFLELQAEAAAEDAGYGATDAPRDSEILASGHY